MGYATQHTSALRTVTKKGAAVTFSHVTPGAYDEATDTYSSPTSVTVPGAAIQVEGQPDTYERLGLVQSSAPTLFFVPTTLGDLPLPGYAVTWAGSSCTVRDVDAIAPDGVAIAATIVVQR